MDISERTNFLQLKDSASTWEEIAEAIPTAILRREYHKRVQVGAPKKLRPCPFCQVQMGYNELRKHKPDCPQRYQNAVSRATEPAGAVEDSGVDV